MRIIVLRFYYECANVGGKRFKHFFSFLKRSFSFWLNRKPSLTSEYRKMLLSCARRRYASCGFPLGTCSI